VEERSRNGDYAGLSCVWFRIGRSLGFSERSDTCIAFRGAKQVLHTNRRKDDGQRGRGSKTGVQDEDGRGVGKMGQELINAMGEKRILKPASPVHHGVRSMFFCFGWVKDTCGREH